MDAKRDMSFLNYLVDNECFNDPDGMLNLIKDADEVAVCLALLQKYPGIVLSSPFVQDRPKPARFVVCEDEFDVKIPYRVATCSGLFGLWAEQRLVLVDTSDASTLPRFSKLPTTHRGTRCIKGLLLTSGGEYIKGISRSTHWTIEQCVSQSRVDALREKAEEAWLDCHLHICKDKNGGLLEDALIMADDGSYYGFRREQKRRRRRFV